MNNKRRPSLGLLGIMQELYDDDIPGITDHQERFAQKVCKKLSGIADWDFPRAARNRNDIEEILSEFNRKNLDGVMIVMLTYGPAMRTVRALQKNSIPLLLANIQPEFDVTNGWNMDDLTYNQGIHGAQDMANTILRTTGEAFDVISADWRSDEFRSYVSDWALASQAASTLKKMKIAVFGKMHGMGDTLTDEAAFTRIIGPEVNREYIGGIYQVMDEISDEEIGRQKKFIHQQFEVDDNLPESNLNYAIRMYLAFKKFLVNEQYSGFSAHFDVFQGDGRFEQIHMLAASNLMADGFGYAAEGDTNTAGMVAAGHILNENAHFTEMYAMDFKREAILMSHMGEGNFKMARKDESVRLANRVLGIGGLDNPPTTVFRLEPGPATIASLVNLTGEKFRLVVAFGKVIDTPKFPKIEMPYFHFKPNSGLRACNDNWLKAGGTHHQTFLEGDQRRKWKMLCRILGIEYIEV